MIINRLMRKFRYLHPELDDVPADTGNKDKGDKGDKEPTPEPAEEIIDDSGGMSQDDINEIVGFEEPAEVVPPVEPEPEPEPAAPTKDVEKEKPAEKDNNDPVPKEVVEPKVEPEPEPEPEPAPVEVDQEKEMADWKAKLTEKYTITEEDAEMVLTNPEKILPQLAANIHAQVMMEMTQSINQAIPQLVAQAIQAQPQMVNSAIDAHTTHVKEQTAFFKSFPQLTEHKKTIAQVANTIHENFPDLTLDEQMQKTGQVAMAMLGLVMKPQEAPAKDVPPVEPFTPASSGIGSPIVSDKENNEWEEFL